MAGVAFWASAFFFLDPVFTGPASMKSDKINFKTGSHSTIHMFKNYFVIVFLVISFQFLVISGIQTDPKLDNSIEKTCQRIPKERVFE